MYSGGEVKFNAINPQEIRKNSSDGLNPSSQTPSDELNTDGSTGGSSFINVGRSHSRVINGCDDVAAAERKLSKQISSHFAEWDREDDVNYSQKLVQYLPSDTQKCLESIADPVQRARVALMLLQDAKIICGR